MTLFRELNKLKEELPKSKINEIIKLEREIDRYYELGKITEEKYNSILKRIKKPTDYEILLKKELKVLSDGLNNMESEFYDKLFEEVEKFTKSKEQNIKKFNVLLKKIKTTGYKYGISKNHKLCRHRWIKVSGPINMGDGEFGQKLRCYVCGKTKTRIS